MQPPNANWPSKPVLLSPSPCLPGENKAEGWTAAYLQVVCEGAQVVWDRSESQLWAVHWQHDAIFLTVALGRAGGHNTLLHGHNLDSGWKREEKPPVVWLGHPLSSCSKHAVWRAFFPVLSPSGLWREASRLLKDRSLSLSGALPWCRKDAASEGKALLNDHGYWVSHGLGWAGQGVRDSYGRS